MRQAVWVWSMPAPALRAMDSGGSVMLTVSPAPAGLIAARVRTSALARRRMPVTSGHHEGDLLDHVAQVAGGIPERLVALGLADPVERADHQPGGASSRRFPGRRPLAKRISPVVGAEHGPAPRDTEVVGDLHLADPVATGEGDALQRDALVDRHPGPTRRRGDERAHGHTRDRHG